MSVDDPADPLSTAASLLDAVGADFAQVPAEIVVDCLYAAELLEQAGGHSHPAPLIDGDPGATLRAAMAALLRLQPDAFASPGVVDAARITRRALRRLA